MPTYEYQCQDCERLFAIEARMSDGAPTQGPGCTQHSCPLTKKISRVAGFVASRAKAPAAPTPAAAPDRDNDPVHLCSKYCDHHKRV